jgi:glycosyltransferase involved in cell wall biosynthesis
MTLRRVAICAAQVPFEKGGAEVHVEALRNALTAAGYQVDVVSLPYKWYPMPVLLQNCLAWRLIDLTESNGVPIDAVIGTKFPSYVIKHPRKVVWVFHQFRQLYDWFNAPHSHHANDAQGRSWQTILKRLDGTTLSEAHRLFATSRNVAQRLARFNQLTAQVLNAPPLEPEKFYSESYGDFVFSANRLDPAKRLHLVIEAMQFVKTPVKCVLAGRGPLLADLQALAARLGVADRVALPGYVPDEQARQLYATCLAVPYPPLDEDYGYVTIEAFLSRRPVITVPDAGGPLEFVEDGQTGYIVATPQAMAARFDELYAQRQRCAELGEAGYARVRDLTWDKTVQALLEGL